MKIYDDKHIKNVAFVGAHKSGKTTLAETMLFEAGLVSRRGSVENKNTIVSRSDILNSVWGKDDYFTGRSLDVFITKIRKYLEKDECIKIESIPTIGYILLPSMNFVFNNISVRVA